MNVVNRYFRQDVPIWPLITLRIGFGLLMFVSICRFWGKGWIEKLYIEPDFHFSYWGFEWVKPLGLWTWLLFALIAVFSLMIAVGLKYQVSIIGFFITFTYVELMDKTTYLNHYYFISCLSWMMIFLPLNRAFSVDAYLSGKTSQMIPKWSIDAVKVFVGIVYFYAGLAKLNSDWLFSALPLKIWLTSRYDLPVLGALFQLEWMHYFMSWAGAFFDLSIVFFLINRLTRIYAFVVVVIFHLMTAWLFPIGMFPFIMIMVVLVFFDWKWHKILLDKIKNVLNFLSQLRGVKLRPLLVESNAGRIEKWKKNVIFLFIFLQLIIPWRYLFYPGELFWTEEGYRFSWRVMLMEKKGNVDFKLVDRKNGESFVVNNSDFLTDLQIKQMSFQPDFILEFAHFLKNHYEDRGMENIEVYADCFVALNGRRSQRFIDPNVDLGKEKKTFKHKKWIVRFEDEIKGL